MSPSSSTVMTPDVPAWFELCSSCNVTAADHDLDGDRRGVGQFRCDGFRASGRVSSGYVHYLTYRVRNDRDPSELVARELVRLGLPVSSSSSTTTTTAATASATVTAALPLSSTSSSATTTTTTTTTTATATATPTASSAIDGELIVDESGWGFMEPEFIRIADGWMRVRREPHDVTPRARERGGDPQLVNVTPVRAGGEQLGLLPGL